jgi:hypothetical protein
MRTNNFALRLPQSLFAHLREAATEDGVAMNQYIAVALAEKLATRKTARQFLAERAEHGSAARALEILERAGTDEDEQAFLARFAMRAANGAGNEARGLELLDKAAGNT